MSVKHFPFRPDLYGLFASRFYERAHKLAQDSSGSEALDAIAEEVAAIARQEADWAANGCHINPNQRLIYRAAWLLLRDLVRVGWRFRWLNGVLELAPPEVAKAAVNEQEARALKGIVRSAMATARLERIAEAGEWIRRMERTIESPARSRRTSVSSLIADGSTLASDLSGVLSLPSREEQLDALGRMVKPYLQLVSEGARCEMTGHRLSDIWRYFRFTWATPAESTPGRTMLYLIRDAARPYHPVMGLASLENAPLRITARDDYLGWTPKSFGRALEAQLEKTPVDGGAHEEAVRAAFERLRRAIALAVADINLEGLCTLEEWEAPTTHVLQRLAELVARSHAERAVALQRWQTRAEGEANLENDAELLERSELGNISTQAEGALYKRKRAESLGRLLSARLAINRLLDSPDLARAWRRFFRSEQGQAAVRNALLATKNRHVGTSILELNVCGAIPPYNEVLGGKLVALLMLSPQVIADYRARYGSRPSDIASRIKGEPVVRPADLAFIGTTSLYRVGSSQYNRLKLNAGLLREGAPPVRWEELGETKGFGTLHISPATLQSLESAASYNGGLIANHVFGEGASPKMRSLRQGFDVLFEPGQRGASDELIRHAMGRIVYGASLASNSREYLRGEADQLDYYFDPAQPPEHGTERIIEFWRERWLLSRLAHAEALQRLAAFNQDTLRVSRTLDDAGLVNTGIQGSGSKPGRVADAVRHASAVDPAQQVLWTPSDAAPQGTTTTALELSLDQLAAFSAFMPQPQQKTPESTSEPDIRRDYVRRFYRGSSAYADEIEDKLLALIHVETDLDRAIVQAVTAGQSVILTGNPGDGKTHLQRVLAPQLEALSNQPHVVHDASTLSDDELKNQWQQAHAEGRPFFAAINQAVLFGLAKAFTDFEPLQEAWRQVEGAVIYGEAPASTCEPSVVVFDLNRRNVLEENVVAAVVDKLTDPSLSSRCGQCPTEGCDFSRNLSLLRSDTQRVRERLQALLDRVSRRGYHGTLREVQSLVSYLLFAGRTCEELLRTSGGDEKSFPQSAFKGEGKLFDAIRETFDPARVAHPVWDDQLVRLETNQEDWLQEWPAYGARVEPDDWKRFEERKRAFYFFHKDGGDLLSIASDDEAEFAHLLAMSDRDARRRLVSRINGFFGESEAADTLRVWQSHRYNQSARRILYSNLQIPTSDFEVVKPRLHPLMAQGFQLSQDHVLLRLKKSPQARLRVDFPLFRLLAQSRRGVPVMALETASTRRLWQWMEQLARGMEEDEREEVEVLVLDPILAEQLAVKIDVTAHQYLSIQERNR